MIQLYCPQRPYPEISFIGIAIQGDRDQRHVGILFRTDRNQKPKLLHLAFHQRLYCENPPYQDIDDIFWLDCPGFDDDEQLQLAVWFEKIFLVNGKNIPYGLAYSPTGYFDSNGTFVRSKNNCGLTCATFILALFESFGFPLVDIESWQHRDDDGVWQQKILDTMREDQRKHPDLYSELYVDNQMSNIGIAVRFRPEEVAASANQFEDEPQTFQVVEPLGKELICKMGMP